MKIKFQYDKLPHGKKELRLTTTCVVIKDEETYVGWVTLNPEDKFVKATGRKLALTKAIEMLPKEVRKEIWKEYFSMCRK